MADAKPLLLGIECGGTRTVALLAGADGTPFERLESGPANLRLVTDADLTAHFRALARQLAPPAAIGVGMAGVRDAADCARVTRVLAKVWPGVPSRVDHDLESALAAAGFGEAEPPPARIVILSGTGSCCFGRNHRGQTAKVGGWGHQLGDRGSGYDLALTALRACARDFDHHGHWGELGRRVLRALALNEPNDLIAWLQEATKREVAALAPEVFAAARGDHTARGVLDEIAARLAEDADFCARRLAKRGAAVEFVFAGSVLLRQPAFARRIARRLRTGWPKSAAKPLARESVWGAVAMAEAALRSAGATRARIRRQPTAGAAGRMPAPQGGSGDAAGTILPESRELSLTERRNPRSRNLDKLPLARAIRLMLDEDALIPAAVRAEGGAIERVIRLVVRALRSGGRLFYVGAGTSGRLGVLDASECPPTFRTSPDLVQGIVAGGARALWSAVEGAEDDAAAGARAVEFRGVGRRDVVLGIAAGGRTAFVWGALHEARRRGARTALLCFNPHLAFARGQRPDVVIAPAVGPEVLTGSTRLKAGTATKLVLNLITTLAMVRLGKVVSNLMVDLNPSNVKLRDRAVRIVRELTGADEATAKAALERNCWVVKAALRRLRTRARVRP